MAIDIRCLPPTEKGVGIFLKPPDGLQDYAGVYGESSAVGRDSLVMSTPQFVAQLDSAGIERTVLIASDKETTLGVKFGNDALAALVAEAPDRLIGFAAVDPNKGLLAVHELEWALRDLGLKGLTIGPWEHGLYPHDERYYPLYELCIAYGVPVTIHASVHFGRSAKLDYSRPLHLDEVAVRFPALTIIAVHGGWPWVAELVAVAWRHPNVHIDISGVRPRYIGKAGTGWEPLITYGNSLLQDQVLWGSGWPLQPFARSLQEVRALPLKPEVVDKWTHHNAARLLGLAA